MEDKKIYTEGIQPQGKFMKWLDNYWYHYKWITIGVAFFVVIFLVCTLQTCEKENEDTTVLYAGPYQMSAREIESFRGVINGLMPEDFDGDGKKYAGIVNYYILSEEQIKEIEAQTDEAGVRLDVNNQYITSNYDSYYDYIMSGESAICFVDKHLYYELAKASRLVPLVSVLGEDSEYESDEYGIILGKTELYESYSALRALPEDTVVCFLRQTVAGRISDDEVYENESALFSAIVTYTKEEQ